LFDTAFDVFSGGVVQEIARLTLDCFHGGLNGFYQRADFSRSVPSLNGCRHRAASFMAQDDDQRRSQMFHRIFQASDDHIVDDVSRDAFNKQVTQALVKNNLRRNP